MTNIVLLFYILFGVGVALAIRMLEGRNPHLVLFLFEFVVTALDWPIVIGFMVTARLDGRYEV